MNEGVSPLQETDIPMLEECLLVAPSNVYTIWVTTDDSLKQKVRRILIDMESKDHSRTQISTTSCRFLPRVLDSATPTSNSFRHLR